LELETVRFLSLLFDWLFVCLILKREHKRICFLLFCYVAILQEEMKLEWYESLLFCFVKISFWWSRMYIKIYCKISNNSNTVAPFFNTIIHNTTTIFDWYVRNSSNNVIDCVYSFVRIFITTAIVCVEKTMFSKWRVLCSNDSTLYSNWHMVVCVCVCVWRVKSMIWLFVMFLTEIELDPK
jgi:hypothetical protein